MVRILDFELGPVLPDPLQRLDITLLEKITVAEQDEHGNADRLDFLFRLRRFGEASETDPFRLPVLPPACKEILFQAPLAQPAPAARRSRRDAVRMLGYRFQVIRTVALI